MTAPDARIAAIREWLEQELGLAVVSLEPASSDASFRRYFRIRDSGGVSRIVMDAPPDREDMRPFLRVGALLEGCGVHVPHVEASDQQRGLALLEDLGSEHYLARLQAGGDPEALYGEAFEALLALQVRGRAAARQLPPYDRAALERELDLMPEWFCGRHLELVLGEADAEVLAATFELLVREALAQPSVLVHRDFHSRNLMYLPARSPGVIDFQDALAGPVGYDLVSLLKDCYIAWPRARVERWVAQYRARLADRGGPVGEDERQFLRWFDLIGLQRHLKVLGIFARLWYRDGKSGYLADLPRTLDYVIDVTRRYPELRVFGDWLERRVLPDFAAANACAQRAARVAGG